MVNASLDNAEFDYSVDLISKLYVACTNCDSSPHDCIVSLPLRRVYTTHLPKIVQFVTKDTARGFSIAATAARGLTSGLPLVEPSPYLLF